DVQFGREHRAIARLKCEIRAARDSKPSRRYADLIFSRRQTGNAELAVGIRASLTPACHAHPAHFHDGFRNDGPRGISNRPGNLRETVERPAIVFDLNFDGIHISVWIDDGGATNLNQRCEIISSIELAIWAGAANQVVTPVSEPARGFDAK